MPMSTNLRNTLVHHVFLAMPLPGPMSEIVADLHASNDDGDGYLAHWV